MSKYVLVIKSTGERLNLNPFEHKTEAILYMFAAGLSDYVTVKQINCDS